MGQGYQYRDSRENDASGAERGDRHEAARLLTGRTQRWGHFVAAGLIVLATMAAYANSFRGVLLFDDHGSIVANPSIRQLWPPGIPLFPPAHGETVSGRPLLNLSLALNYRFGGTHVWGYHAVNLAIHVLAALLLFGILRRTLELADGGRWAVDGGGGDGGEMGHEISDASILPSLSTVHRTRFVGAPPSTSLAFAIALLWALHPLQTESVTYIVQRAESLCGLFYLLTLYCVIRGAASARTVPWSIAAILACLLGMATKEVMVTAPLMVLVYDRTFLAGSFGQALRRRWGLYLGLAATWLPLAWLVLSTGLLGKSAGYGAPEAVGAWDYLRSQPPVILHYLRLSLWPHPLCLDYGREAIAGETWQFRPATIVVGLLLAATVWGLFRRRSSAFLGAWWFLILAPSSLVPLRDVAFEHRMYLPLAVVMTTLVLGGYAAGRALVRRGLLPLAAVGVAGAGLVTLAGAALAILTVLRNQDYRDDLAITEDTVAKAPRNERAQFNVANALRDCGRWEEAIVHYRETLAIRPDWADPHNNLGNVLWRHGKLAEAIFHFREFLALSPECEEVWYNLGNVLFQQGDLAESAGCYREALDIRPDFAEAHNNLGNALGLQGRLAEAIGHYLKAVAIRPGYVQAWKNLGTALFQQGRMPQALAAWHEAIRLQPDAVEVLNMAAWVLATHPDAKVRSGAESVELAERAARLAGGADPAVLDTLAAGYAECGRFPDAVRTARQALSLIRGQPNAALAGKLEARVKMYQEGIPYRDRGR